MRSRLTIIFLFILINSISSQNSSIKTLLNKTKGLDMWDLVEFAQNNIEDDRELASFFFYWIGSNIEYDYTFLKAVKVIDEEYLKKQSPYTVYEEKKAICEGYAKLFKWFMNEIDIDSVIISGFIRDERNHYIELESDAKFKHAWNAIKINNEWLIVDTTWGRSGNSVVSDFYFDMKPSLAIITHFPEESKWQLLQKTLSIREFNQSKFIKPIWFLVGFSDIPKLKKDDNYYYFVYKNNPDKNWLVSLMFSTNNLDFIQIQNTVKIDQDGYSYIRFDKNLIPKKAFFKVGLIKINDISYSDVINFKI